MSDLSKIQESNEKLSETVSAFKEVQEEQNRQSEAAITGLSGVDTELGNSFVSGTLTSELRGILPC